MIRVDDNWLLGTNEHCWIIYEDKHRKKMQKGKQVDVIEPRSYHGTLSGALNHLRMAERMRVGKTLDCDLKDALHRLARADTDLLEAVKRAIPQEA